MGEHVGEQLPAPLEPLEVPPLDPLELLPEAQALGKKQPVSSTAGA
jgi:hypothetical protein